MTMRKLCCTILMLLVGGAALAEEPKRPEVTAIRVPDGAITVDGFDADWQGAGDALARCRASCADKANLGSVMSQRGEWSGPDDCSLAVWLATDSQHFYVLGDVRDQILTNTSSVAMPFFGDDFEIFIDASPPAARFAQTKSENFRQLIFVPAYVNPEWPQTLIWEAATNPGVTAASRLRPWGYTIEIRVPKALFPHWKQNPDMDSIGFDVMLADADAPGVDAVHPAIKCAFHLLQVGSHFMGPARLSLAKLETQPVQLADVQQAAPPAADQLVEALKAATTETAESLAQHVLDYLPTDQAGKVADAAFACAQKPVKRAGLFIYAQRPQLPAPAPALVAMLEPGASNYGSFSDHDLRQYAMIALARRGKLPVDRFFGFYTRVDAPPVRLTYVWALGVNANRAIVPELCKLLYDGNLRVRMMAALSLSALGDPAAIAPLQEMAANDPHHYGQNQASLAIKQLQAK